MGSFDKSEFLRELEEGKWNVIDYIPGAFSDIEYTRDWSKRSKYLLKDISGSYVTIMSEYVAFMMQQRCSWNTMKSYCGAFYRFVKTENVTELKHASVATTNSYLGELGAREISYQELNRHCSAIKFYMRCKGIDVKKAGTDLSSKKTKDASKGIEPQRSQIDF